MSSSISSLVPNIEHRLAGWVRIQERQAAPPEPRRRPTITLSREFGCEGFPVSERLQTLFEEATGEAWTLFDKALMEKIALDEGVSPWVLERLGQMPRVFDALGFKPMGSALSQDALYEKVVRCIAPIALEGNAIIVGRGGAILCQRLSNCFHFRLIAGLRWRIETYARRARVPLGEAEQIVRTSSEHRTRFISKHLGAEIADPRYFDAVFNNERHTAEEISRAIFAYVKSAWHDHELFKGG